MRIARLDGIRAVAIALVFARHTLSFMPGWVGVELFFVLSGYLITGILRRDRNQPAFWSTFYIKRATRILPPLVIFFALAFSVTDVPWHMMAPYYALFAANIGEARHPFAGKELTILWSLSVEEHFYLLWPFAVRLLDRRRLLYLLAGLLLLEPILRGLATAHVNSYWPIYVLTPFRLDGLAAGGLLALLLESTTWAHRFKRWSGRVALGCLGAYVLCSLAPGFSERANSVAFNLAGYTLITAAATFWIAFTLGNDTSLSSRWLSAGPVAWVGLISYGFYLYHVLVVRAVQLVLWRIHFDHMRTVLPFTLAASLLLSWLSYTYWEQPIMQWGQRKARALRPAAPRKQPVRLSTPAGDVANAGVNRAA